MSAEDLEGGGWGPAQRLLAAAVARRFHLAGRTKVQIGEELGISRFKVARILDSALAQGLVRVEINVGEELAADLSDELRASYGLRRAVVMGGSGDETPARTRQRLAGLAAALVEELVTPGEILGLAWARTVNEMVDALRDLAPCTVVQLCGVYSRLNRRDDSAETVRRAAARSEGEAFPIYAPLVLPDAGTARALRHQPGISDAFDRFDRITTAVVPVGAWRPTESTVYDVLPEAERAALARTGVQGELAGHLFDGDGRTLDTGLSHHVLSISVEQLRAIPEVIALAAGRVRAEAIDAVLRSGLVTTLVTDSAAAEALISLAARRPPRAPATDRATPPTRPGHAPPARRPGGSPC
jgi:DNA-binding transcriptional regulator LsrR (DeoR family)